ncbi:MAG: ABC transporter ATP-binding protein [Aggregatilineales bacterium]
MLEIDHISFAYDDVPIINDVSFSIDKGEIICLLGPSGCGKTTLLRLIAGLETHFEGDIRLNGGSLKNMSVHEREFGFMFQDFALFPHMSVAENAGFGLKMRQYQKSQISERVDDMLQLVGLEDFGSRDVNELSGGEKQRVALARSLAPNPKLLMLDEPLGSLDAALRRRLMLEIRQIIKTIGLTSIYVTHDQEEAFTVADRIVLLNAGQVEQIDAPIQLYKKPKTRFAAQFLGLQSNIITITGDNGEEMKAALSEIRLLFPEVQSLLIHPAGIQLHQQDETLAFTGMVKDCSFRGATYRIVLEVEPTLELVFEIPSFSAPIADMGERLKVYVIKDALVPLLQN